MVEIIAIDGPASVGKSTLAKKISNYYEVPLLNSGRLYRAVALKIINKKININNKYKILQCAKSLTDENIKSKKLFSSKIDKIASEISSKKYLRKQLMAYQREFPKNMLKARNLQLLKEEILELKYFHKLKLKFSCGQMQKFALKEDTCKLKKRAKKLA